MARTSASVLLEEAKERELVNFVYHDAEFRKAADAFWRSLPNANEVLLYVNREKQPPHSYFLQYPYVVDTTRGGTMLIDGNLPEELATAWVFVVPKAEHTFKIFKKHCKGVMFI